MRITTFNVNGVRSWYEHYRTCKSWSFDQTLDSLQSDIICIQETKTNERGKVDACILHPHRYKAYFAFPRRPKKIGHAGVAIFTRFTPTSVCDSILECGVNLEYGPDDMAVLKKVDSEGRFIMCAFGPDLLIVNVYCTNDGGENTEIALERREERRVLFGVLREMVKEKRKHFVNVFVMGDFNVVYHPLDHCDYAKQYLTQYLDDSNIDQFLATDDPKTGLLSQFYDDTEKPIRRWFRQWLIEDGVIDTFRRFYPLVPFRYTCWNTKVSARVSNHGTRIDTILYAGDQADTVLTGCDQLNDYKGSDHCPVWVDVTVDVLEGVAKGGQSKLTCFFVKNTADMSVVDDKMEKDVAEPAVKRPKVSLLEYVSVKNSVDSPSKVEQEKEVDPESDLIATTSSPLKAVKQSENWSALFKQAASRRKPPPLCPSHQKECILLKVSKKGPNIGRQFYICSIPVPERCDFFQWLH